MSNMEHPAFASLAKTRGASRSGASLDWPKTLEHAFASLAKTFGASPKRAFVGLAEDEGRRAEDADC